MSKIDNRLCYADAKKYSLLTNKIKNTENKI